MKILSILILSIFLFSTCKTDKKEAYNPHNKVEKIKSDINETTLIYPQEKHIKNLKQLTFGGDNAEAYWSFDDKSLVFQASNKAWGAECDQIYFMNPNVQLTAESTHPLLSTGKGRTTCSYFMPGDKSVIYASTHLDSEA